MAASAASELPLGSLGACDKAAPRTGALLRLPVASGSRCVARQLVLSTAPATDAIPSSSPMTPSGMLELGSELDARRSGGGSCGGGSGGGGRGGVGRRGGGGSPM